MLKLYIVLIAALLALLAYVVLSNHQPRTAPPSASAVVAASAPETMNEIKHDVVVAGGSVKAYGRPIKQKLDLPPDVVKDETKVVASSAVVPQSDHPQEVTAVVDTKTGDVVEYVKEKPLPLAAVDLRGEAGVYYGLRSDGQKVARLEVRQDLFQVKAIHLQLIGSVDQSIDSGKADGCAGIGIIYRW